jgi:hypothetical protein
MAQLKAVNPTVLAMGCPLKMAVPTPASAPKHVAIVTRDAIRSISSIIATVLYILSAPVYVLASLENDSDDVKLSFQMLLCYSTYCYLSPHRAMVVAGWQRMNL